MKGTSNITSSSRELGSIRKLPHAAIVNTAHQRYCSSLERTFNLDTCANHVKRDRQREPLRLDVVDLHRVQALWASKVDLVVKGLAFPTIALFLAFPRGPE